MIGSLIVDSKHIIKNEIFLESFQKKKIGIVTFDDNGKTKVIVFGNIVSCLSINSILIMDGLHHNLINVIQVCDSGYNVVFTSIE